jgi:hypothetical protein
MPPSHHSPFTMHRAPCTTHHAPCTMHHAPCTLHHTPCTTCTICTMHHAPHTTHRVSNADGMSDMSCRRRCGCQLSCELFTTAWLHQRVRTRCVLPGGVASGTGTSTSVEMPAAVGGIAILLAHGPPHAGPLMPLRIPAPLPLLTGPHPNFRLFPQAQALRGLPACALCLATDPHDTRKCRSETLWDGSKARCRKSEEGRLVTPAGTILCSDWNNRRGCTSTLHEQRHECSGCGSKDHGAQGCPRAQKKPSAHSLQG